MNKKNTDALERIENEYSEWKEELGDQFPIFLNYVLVARLCKAEMKIETLRARLNSQPVVVL